MVWINGLLNSKSLDKLSWGDYGVLPWWPSFLYFVLCKNILLNCFIAFSPIPKTKLYQDRGNIRILSYQFSHYLLIIQWTSRHMTWTVSVRLRVQINETVKWNFKWNKYSKNTSFYIYELYLNLSGRGVLGTLKQ